MNLKFIGLVCLDMFLQCTNYKRSMSRDSGSKVKKPINVANIAHSWVFELLMLRGLKVSGMIDLDVNLCLTSFGGWRSSGLGSKVENRKILTSS